MTGDARELTPEERAAVAAQYLLKSRWVEAITGDHRFSHTEARIAAGAIYGWLHRDPKHARFGMFWMSNSTLMDAFAVGERTVRRALKKLRDFGYTELVAPGGGRQKSAVYRMTLPAGNPATNGQQTRPPAAQNPATSGQQTRPPVAPNPISEKPRIEEPESVATCAHDPGDFENFWEVYPHKVDKVAAEAAYQRAIADGASPAEILTGLELYVATKPPDRNWLNPETFLTKKRWRDRPAPVQQAFIMSINGGNRDGQDRRAAREAERTSDRQASLAAGAAEMARRVGD